MNQNTTYYVGVDISKHSLDISIAALNISFKTSNSSNGFARLLSGLLRRLKGLPFHILFEASGGYERPLFDWLCLHNIPCSIVNPNRVRNFAKAQGLLAKTDAIDARLISLFGATFSVQQTPPPSPTLRQLDSLINRRDDLKVLLTSEKNRLEHSQAHPLVTKQIKSHIKSIEKQILQIEQWIDDLLQSDPDLQQKVDRLSSVKGIAKLSALCFLAKMPELGSLSRQEAAALAGVAPYNCDSGSRRGQRMIRGGRASLRKTLYMVALVACRYNPILKNFYDNLINRGKPPKVAITAVMRKIIQLANLILKDPSFQPA